MKFQFKLLYPGIFFCGILVLTLQSCTKDKGELGTVPTASFTYSPVAGKINTYALSSTSKNAYRYQWESGDGSAAKAGQPEDTVYYLRRGDYKVKLYAYGRGGYAVDSQVISVPLDDPSSPLTNPTFLLLYANTWKFDPDPNAKAIIVGTENNPGEYYPGGPLADCQLDDTYRFGYNNGAYELTYAANGSTFNGGNVAPNYSCATDRSYTSGYTFSNVVDGAGIATITIPGATPPTKFIGTTDIPSNDYRIISVNATRLVLRAGTRNGTVFQFKFVAQ